MKMKALFAVLFVLMMATMFANTAQSEMKIFIKEYTYQASEADSKVSARWASLEQTKRLLLEELGTYLESQTEVVNFQLTKDKIVSFTAGVVKVQVENEKWDGTIYWIKAKIVADPDEVAKTLNGIRKDNDLSKKLEIIQAKADEAMQEKERMSKELKALKASQGENEVFFKKVKEVNDGWSKGLGYLEKAKQLAKIPGKEQESTYYRKLAIQNTNEAFVNDELPEIKYYPIGSHQFSLKAGEQTDHWMTPLGDDLFDIRFFTADNANFVVVYKNGTTQDPRKYIDAGGTANGFKFRAITDCNPGFRVNISTKNASM